jgi:hypothetical protein
MGGDRISLGQRVLPFFVQLPFAMAGWLAATFLLVQPLDMRPVPALLVSALGAFLVTPLSEPITRAAEARYWPEDVTVPGVWGMHLRRGFLGIGWVADGWYIGNADEGPQHVMTIRELTANAAAQNMAALIRDEESWAPEVIR